LSRKIIRRKKAGHKFKQIPEDTHRGWRENTLVFHYRRLRRVGDKRTYKEVDAQTVENHGNEANIWGGESNEAEEIGNFRERG